MPALPQVVLYQPEIPPNTGNIGRLCLSAGTSLHLVRPLGFEIDDRALRRAGLDYWKHVDVTVWDSLTDLQRAAPPSATFYYLTARATRPYWDVDYSPDDYLVFGPETRGLPADIIAANPGTALTIPMPGGGKARSLNLSGAASIVLYEAVRQSQKNLPCPPSNS